MMRELVYHVAVTLDGFIAGPDGDTSAFPVDGDDVTALLREYPDTIPTHVQRAAGIEADRSRYDTIIMGWRTYTPALTAGIASPYAHLRQIVASRQERPLPPDIERTADPVATVRTLKAEQGSGIYLAGGGELAAALVDEVDRLLLKVHPFLLGAGVGMFGGAGTEGAAPGPRRFRPVRRREFDSGVVFAEYVRA
ncbi:dihydrofolate reductase family protein [Georgenia faecalis]|nr:dihydrofolate reductase family protein [Georgenia faecalis]